MELNLPDNFLNGEVRNGFYVESMMKKNWACMIKILAEIDRICKKHDIQYFADWGTLLGAVRHKGFIPWDDDIDIAMKRADYMRFCEVAKTELPDDWEMMSVHNTTDWNQIVGHVVTGRKADYSEEHHREWYGFPYVPGVDVFPLDYMPRSDEEYKFTCDVYQIVGAAATEYTESGASEEQKEQVISDIEQMCGVKIDRSKNIVNQLLCLQERLSMMYTESESDNLLLMVGYVVPRIKKYVYPKEWYESTIDMPFEYITVPVPVGYEGIIRRKYGDNWMTPFIGGGSHGYPYYKKQQTQVWKELGLL